MSQVVPAGQEESGSREKGSQLQPSGNCGWQTQSWEHGQSTVSERLSYLADVSPLTEGVGILGQGIAVTLLRQTVAGRTLETLPTLGVWVLGTGVTVTARGQAPALVVTLCSCWTDGGRVSREGITVTAGRELRLTDTVLADVVSFTERVRVLSQGVTVTLGRETLAHDAPGRGQVRSGYVY